MLDWVVFDCFGGTGDVQSQFAEFEPESLPSDPQQEGSLLQIPMRIFHDTGKQKPVHFQVRFRVHVADIGCEPLTYHKSLHVAFLLGWRRQVVFARPSQSFGQE